jgi:hypothetical protein
VLSVTAGNRKHFTYTHLKLWEVVFVQYHVTYFTETLMKISFHDYISGLPRRLLVQDFYFYSDSNVTVIRAAL